MRGPLTRGHLKTPMILVYVDMTWRGMAWRDPRTGDRSDRIIMIIIMTMILITVTIVILRYYDATMLLLLLLLRITTIILNMLRRGTTRAGMVRRVMKWYVTM